ncbi:MAG: hypothetical protein J6I87_05525 [Rikenellaceae bacterium]|nr:hypothetical protein [Rikenellaceae bacterium]
MKALKYFASALALVALFTACEEESEYQPAQLPETQEAYFPATTMTVSMEELTNGFEVELARVNYDEAATATLKSERPEGVNVPSTVSFNAGQEKTTFTVSVDQAALGQGKTFKIVMNVDSESNSPYANQRCTVTLTTWSPTPPASWRPIETQALFVENASVASEFFGTESGFTFPVYVEKLDGSEVYRIANLFSTYTSEAGVTYSHPYWYYYIDESYLEDAENVHYTYIDCEGYYWDDADKASWKKGWAFMPLQGQNFGLNPPAYGYNQWGSFGYTFSGQTPSDTNMGKYNEANKSITFASGSLVKGMSAYNGGGWYTSGVSFVLFLDQNLAGTDFERDCAFSKLQDATWQSEILDSKWGVALYEGVPSDEEKAAEYAEKFGQVIKVENAFVEGFPVYFCVDAEGKISVPEDYASQEMGMSIAGFDLYFNIKKGEFANNSYTILGEMVGIDPTGVKADVIYGEYTEVINAEVIGAAESIDDFVGKWVLSAETDEYDSEGVPTGNYVDIEIPVELVKVDEETIKMVGLTYGSFGDYDDSIVWTYNGGFLQMTAQDMPDWANQNGVEFDCIATVCNFESLFNLNAAGLIFLDAGITDAGVIKFFDDPGNASYDIEVNGFGIYGIYNGNYYAMSDILYNGSMTAATEGAARTEFVTKPQVAPVMGTVVTELRKADRELTFNGQKVTKKSKGKRTPVFRPADNAVEVTLR